MITELSSLRPQNVFAFFYEISKIPRGSSNEKAVSEYLCRFAEERGLYYRTDALYNVLITKEATKGYENEPAVMLQGHTDMVCQKCSDVEFDFTHDPLHLIAEDGWLHADGTTLGADDGIAAAMMLAVLDDDTLEHPFLECLFTTQEETGLGGAAGFDYTGIRAKLLYNLDSEEEGVGTASCAGGIHCDITRHLTRSAVSGVSAKISVTGLRGGHSGEDIGLHRANAHRVMGQLLLGLSEKADFRIVSMTGGNMDNAIARDCTAEIVFSAEEKEAVSSSVLTLAEKQMSVFSGDDRVSGKITVGFGEGSFSAVSEEDTVSVIGLLTLPPNGVVSMCEDLPSLVETSSNVGILQMEEDIFTLGFLSRSSVEERKEEMRRQLAYCAKLCHADFHDGGSYPGWAFDKNSEAARRFCLVYERITKKPARIEAIHAGLECGLIRSAVPGIDPISIGPDMKDIHTPAERVDIASVGRVYETLLGLLAFRE